MLIWGIRKEGLAQDLPFIPDLVRLFLEYIHAVPVERPEDADRKRSDILKNVVPSPSGILQQKQDADIEEIGHCRVGDADQAELYKLN